ncbi:unnamed protein product [Orchesella dallaii]|uniref:Uncharacterized protein n=1 Tax=Orchesella dallaii TaxID=48710 RepID=A0ABP1PSJ3_9HEXA
MSETENHVVTISTDIFDEEGDYVCDLEEVDPLEPVINPKPYNRFRWLQLDSSIRLNLAGTDWSPRIEIDTVPSGRHFHHGVSKKMDEKSGRLVPDQKLFSLLNSRNQTLLTIDYSNDLRSFHVMEPDSDRFIAFFTLPPYPPDPMSDPCTIEIHNVVDQEIYVVNSVHLTDLTITIKSESGEELAVIMRPPPKWTASQPGLMTLHFSGDDREGLTCRERAVILGFFLAIGVQAMSHWKRSSVGILAVYVFSAVCCTFIILFVYMAFRQDGALNSNNLNILRNNRVGLSAADLGLRKQWPGALNEHVEELQKLNVPAPSS